MNQTTPNKSTGRVVSVQGSVIDIRFEDQLPPVNTILQTGQHQEILIEIRMQVDPRHVRGISLTPTRGLRRGAAVLNTGLPLRAPVGPNILSRMFNVFGDPIDKLPPPTDVEWRSVNQDPPPLSQRSTSSEIFETGIKISSDTVGTGR